VGCFTRAAEVARAAGSTLNEVSAESTALGVKDRSLSPVDRLVYLQDRWEHWHRAGSTPAHWHVARKVAFALVRAGDNRAVAVLLGADELDALMAVGAGMDHAERGRYVQEALQSAVARQRLADT
jgi:hypothetical protein